LVNGTTHAPWGIGLRNSPRQALTVEKEGRSPGQLADWHAFTIDVWNEHLRAMHLAVNGVLPTATIVVREVDQSGVAGIGVGATDVRENVGHAPFPIVQVGPSVHDAAWGAASLVARAKAERPVMVAIPCDRGDTTRGAAVLAAIAEGAIAIELPATAFADPDVRRIAGWLGEVEADLTASTRLDDRLTWIDDPTHAGADLDDLDGIARRGEMDRSDVAGAYAAVREAGLAPVIVDVEAFAPDDAQDLGALLVPTRRWTDLERYGSLVVHVLRGGNLVAFPHAPRRQRDGTAFRSTFLWPASVSGGGRVQVHDGTSTLVSTPASEPTVGDRAEWIEDVIDAVSPRFRIARGMRLAVTARLLPDGACLAFVMNPTNRRQVGAVTVPDAGALGLADTYDVVVAIATSGASVRREGMGFLVDVPPGGAVVARLSDSARAPMPR
jgi:hypothetical protein